MKATAITITTRAYNYDAQKWTKGDSARVLLRAQLRETLELLEGPTGAEYAAFTGGVSREALIVEYRRALKVLS